MKIYVDTVTKELVLNNGIEYRYPAYCEIQRQKQGDFIIIKTTNNVSVLDYNSRLYRIYRAESYAIDGYTINRRQ